MSRWLILVTAGIAMIALGLVAALVFGPRTCLRETVEVDGAKITFRITETNGSLYAVANETTGGGGGWKSEILIGNVDTIGRGNPRLFYESHTGRVRLEIGRASIEFNTAAHSFAAPVIDP